MICQFYNISIESESISRLMRPSAMGVSMLDIENTAIRLGFRTRGVKMTLSQLEESMPLPCILHWNNRHFVVCYDIKKRNGKARFYIADPATDKFVCQESQMKDCWLNYSLSYGTALAILPEESISEGNSKKSCRTSYLKALSFFFKYIRPHRKAITLLLFNMLLGCILQLIFPFLSQHLVDFGINHHHDSIIGFIILGQFAIIFAQMICSFLQNWLLLHINARVHITIISDFLLKLMQLPLQFFDSKKIGDILQRISDHSRIEAFLTNSAISTTFSILSLIVFSIVLAIYNTFIFCIFIFGNTLYILWILAFMKYRSKIDAMRFAYSASEQSNLIQLVTGMPDIKLSCNERQKRWEWERIQLNLLDINVKSQTIQQIQQCGSVFFNQATNLLITYITAKNVITGNMTIGMMVSLTYIVGAINVPISNFITFIRQFQDAKLSIERLKEIHDGNNDELEDPDLLLPESKHKGDIIISNLSFRYNISEKKCILSNISAVIPSGKVTAIVGASGSGKTTLLKLLMGFYDYTSGNIKIGATDLNRISKQSWRKSIGSVLQDGYIFSDTIEANIALGYESIEQERLDSAIRAANLQDFVNSLPLKVKTKIGMEGNGLSQGQRQRILLARVLYKNPEYVFLDEATNSLDTHNERIILDNLKKFYTGKTVIIAAHRLSTVTNADLILVIDQGVIVEQGNHNSLVKHRGLYYKLVSNQLKLT